MVPFLEDLTSIDGKGPSRDKGEQVEINSISLRGVHQNTSMPVISNAWIWAISMRARSTCLQC